MATGSAAVTYAVQNIVRSGDHIVSASNLYGGTYNLFANMLSEQGIIGATFVDQSEPSNFADAIRENTKLLFAETLGNPNSDVVDLRAIAEIAHAHGIPFIVDSTFATPFLLRPIEYRVDVVIHSATKFIGGHGTVMGGVIVDAGTFDWAQKFTESLELLSLLANVADVKSLVIHPASTPHSQLSEQKLLNCGIKPNTVRLSIGTEHIDDILFDLDQGFRAVGQSQK